MARTSYIDLPTGFAPHYFRDVQPGNRYISARIRAKTAKPSRLKVEALKGRSFLDVISAAWAGLSDSERDAWSVAGDISGLNGWRQFVADTSARIQNGMSGVATPTILHQAWIGNLHIESPASEMELEQEHLAYYYVKQLVQGKQSMFEPVLVNEVVTLPLTLQISYSADLSAVGGGAYAKYSAHVWSVFQGEDVFTDLDIPLLLSTDWETLSAELSTVPGVVVAYSLKLKLYNVTGDLYFDNIKATHSGQNWCRDTNCDDINPSLSAAFSQVADIWTPVLLPEGASFESIYKDF